MKGRFPGRRSLRAFTFAALPCLRVVEDGSPVPVALRKIVSSPEASVPRAGAAVASADASVLAALELPERTVSAVVQPWDPLVRWYSADDPCYPLVADLGDDGVTLFASGPARATSTSR